MTDEQLAKPGLLMKYFVLKPAGGDAYAVASRSAMRAYAFSVMDINAEFAGEILDWVRREEAKDLADFPVSSPAQRCAMTEQLAKPERLGWKSPDERAETIEAANEWEKRALASEARVRELEQALQEIEWI